MFRHKDIMLNNNRSIKKKNTNKEDKEEKFNEKDLYRFELKGIQQELMKEGIRVHMNDLRAIRHLSLDKLDEKEKNEIYGNTTLKVLLEKLNKNEYKSFSFGENNKEIIAKTHDMTRWKDNKKKTLDRKKERKNKMNSLESEESFVIV